MRAEGAVIYACGEHSLRAIVNGSLEQKDGEERTGVA